MSTSVPKGVKCIVKAINENRAVAGVAFAGGAIVAGLGAYFFMQRSSKASEDEIFVGESSTIHELEPPRVVLASLNTPVVQVPLGAVGIDSNVEVYVKLDSETGCGISGNKIRKLEYILFDALAKNATTVLTCGGIQSNHARATAFASRRLGMKPHLVLRGEAQTKPQGNLLLDLILGAEVTYITREQYSSSRNEIMQGIANEATDEAYVIPEGGSNALGCWGYIRMISELLDDTGACRYDVVVVPVGSGGTIAGLIIGRALLDLDFQIWGVNVCDDAEYFHDEIARIVSEFNEAYGTSVVADNFQIIDGYVGEGYGIPYEQEIAMIRELAKSTGIVLSQTYTGKAFYGFVEHLNSISPPVDAKCLFIHTGGIFELFALDPTVLGVVPT